MRTMKKILAVVLLTGSAFAFTDVAHSVGHFLKHPAVVSKSAKGVKAVGKHVILPAGKAVGKVLF